MRIISGAVPGVPVWQGFRLSYRKKPGKYWHWFKLLGLIEPTDRQEPAIYDFLEERAFYRLTSKGEAEVRAWEDPISVRRPEFR